jgi:hypothetical protein
MKSISAKPKKLKKATKVTKAELLARIVTLEKQVADLLARPWIITVTAPPLSPVTVPPYNPVPVPTAPVIPWPPYTPYIGDPPGGGTTTCSAATPKELNDVRSYQSSGTTSDAAKTPELPIC